MLNFGRPNYWERKKKEKAIVCLHYCPLQLLEIATPDAAGGMSTEEMKSNSWAIYRTQWPTWLVIRKWHRKGLGNLSSYVPVMWR